MRGQGELHICPVLCLGTLSKVWYQEAGTYQTAMLGRPARIQILEIGHREAVGICVNMAPGGESCAEKEPQKSSEALTGLFHKDSAVHAQSKTLG